jgi:hypothetical protein
MFLDATDAMQLNNGKLNHGMLITVQQHHVVCCYAAQILACVCCIIACTLH